MRRMKKSGRGARRGTRSAAGTLCNDLGAQCVNVVLASEAKELSDGKFEGACLRLEGG